MELLATIGVPRRPERGPGFKVQVSGFDGEGVRVQGSGFDGEGFSQVWGSGKHVQQSADIVVEHTSIIHRLCGLGACDDRNMVILMAVKMTQLTVPADCTVQLPLTIL